MLRTRPILAICLLRSHNQCPLSLPRQGHPWSKDSRWCQDRGAVGPGQVWGPGPFHSKKTGVWIAAWKHPRILRDSSRLRFRAEPGGVFRTGKSYGEAVEEPHALTKTSNVNAPVTRSIVARVLQDLPLYETSVRLLRAHRTTYCPYSHVLLRSGSIPSQFLQCPYLDS